MADFLISGCLPASTTSTIRLVRFSTHTAFGIVYGSAAVGYVHPRNYCDWCVIPELTSQYFIQISTITIINPRRTLAPRPLQTLPVALSILSTSPVGRHHHLELYVQRQQLPDLCQHHRRVPRGRGQRHQLRRLHRSGQAEDWRRGRRSTAPQPGYSRPAKDRQASPIWDNDRGAEEPRYLV